MARFALNQCQQSPGGSPPDLAGEESHKTGEKQQPKQEWQPGLFCLLGFSKKVSSAGKKTPLQLQYNSALNVSNQMTKIHTNSQFSHREGDAWSFRSSVSFLSSYTRQENISPASVLRYFYLPFTPVVYQSPATLSGRTGRIRDCNILRECNQ